MRNVPLYPQKTNVRTSPNFLRMLHTVVVRSSDGGGSSEYDGVTKGGTGESDVEGLEWGWRSEAGRWFQRQDEA